MAMPRKKKIILISLITTVIVILLIISVGAYLYLKTDMFKSNEQLFGKYLMQNFDLTDCFNTEYASEIKNVINNNKYTSNIKGEIEYKQNVDSEDKDAAKKINDMKLSIISNIEGNNNNYNRNIKLMDKEETVFSIDTIQSSNNFGIKLNGVKQYIAEENGENELEDIVGLKELQKWFQNKRINTLGISNIDIDKLNLEEIFKFTEEEKTTLANKYYDIIQKIIPKNSYKKQKEALITIKDQSFNTTAYYVELPRETYNELIVSLLNELKDDEIILGKIDLMEEKLQSIYKTEDSFRKFFVEYINKKIEENNNNVKNDTIKITVYQNNMKTVRTRIETEESNLTIDLLDSGFRIDDVKLGASQDEQIIEVQRQGSDNTEQIVINSNTVKSNSVINDSKISINKSFENTGINKNIEINLSNEKYKSDIKLTNNIRIVDNFNDKNNSETIDDFEKNLEDAKKLIHTKDISEEQLKSISELLQNKMKSDVQKLEEKASVQDYLNMFINLNVIKKQDDINLDNSNEVSETEKRRFNSSFEYYQTSGLTKENMNNFIDTMSKNINSVKITNKNNNVYKLTSSLLEDKDKMKDIKDNLKEIIITIKEKENENEYSELLKNIFENQDKTYTGKLDYNETTGLVEKVHITLDEKE